MAMSYRMRMGSGVSSEDHQLVWLGSSTEHLLGSGTFIVRTFHNYEGKDLPSSSAGLETVGRV